MTDGDRRSEPVYEIDLRDLSAEDAVGTVGLIIRDDEPEPHQVDPPALEHPHPAVRLAALSQLRDHPGSAPAVAVSARLRDPEPGVRRLAVELLEGAGDERALLLLLDAIEDPVEELRSAAREALRRRKSPKLLDLIRRELTVPTRAHVAARALAELTEARPEEGERPPEDRPTTLGPLSGSWDLRALLEALTDPLPERRRIACDRLGSLGARSAVRPLIERLGDPERGVRMKAADALGRIGDERALERLERASASDPDAGVRLALARAAATLRKLQG